MPVSENVCVLIPTLDEAATIGGVIDGFAEAGFEHVLVVDGHSDDETVAVARDHGAEVLVQSGDGKGQAVREALTAIDRDVVLLVDGDGTYRSEDAEAMVEPIEAESAAHVIGNRFADLRPGAMSALNRVGNRVINWVFKKIHGRNFQDILSGYRAFTTESARRMHLTAEGFGIETELAVECVRNDIDTAVVGITYQPRPDQSSTNLRPFRDGGVILTTLYRLARTTNPLFYFGSVGVLSSLVAFAIGIFVAYEWFVRGIPHVILAMVTVFGILFGFQLLTFGVLTDMIVRLRR